MQRSFRIILAFVMTTAFISCSRPDRVWRGLKTPSEVEEFVRKALPSGSNAEETLRFLEGYRLPCSGLTEGAIYASAPAGRIGFLIDRKWLLVFRFDSRGVMTNLDIRAGLTGP
jgi:hypothetical protein